MAEELGISKIVQQMANLKQKLALNLALNAVNGLA